MNPDNQQLEKLLDRLDAGASLASIEAELGAEVQDYLEVVEFLRAQQSEVLPNPESLRQALLQGDLIAPKPSRDDWGAFSVFQSGWKTWGGLGVSMFGVAVIAASWWNPAPEVIAPQTEMVRQKAATMEVAEADVANSVASDENFAASPMMARMAEPVAEPDPETDAWVKAWQSDFESEMEEFNAAKATLEPTYADPLFSVITPSQS